MMGAYVCFSKCKQQIDLGCHNNTLQASEVAIALTSCTTLYF